ncbi:MAG: hypothetical protein ABFS41_02730 [Myxococcota bacterium]
MRLRGFGLGLTLALAVGCAGSPSDEDARLAAGRADYESYCMACHGALADGTGPAAAGLREELRDAASGAG